MANFRITDCTVQRTPGRLMRRIDKLMRGLMDERLAGIGTSYPQWATLKMVRDGVVGTAGELARDLGYTSGATTRLVDSLERRGLVVRTRDAADRRVVRLEVTPDGDRIVDRGLPLAIGLWNEMVADLDQEEANRLVETLVKLLATIEARAGENMVLAEAAE